MKTQLKLISAPLSDIETDWLVVGLCNGENFPADVQELDRALSGMITQLQKQGDLKGKAGETLLLPVAPGAKAARIILVGLGDAEKISLSGWEQAVLAATRKAACTENSSIAIALPEAVNNLLGVESAITTAVIGACIGESGQGIYKKDAERHPFRSISIVAAKSASAQQALERGQVLGDAVNLTRELVNRHPEEIYPETFAKRAKKEATAVGIQVEIFDQARLKKEKMGALLAVARGSSHEPRVVVLKYQGADKKSPDLALCGKGVTFDSGGLSLKPSGSMIGMKADMAGAATVLGAMIALAKLKAPINVLGVVGLVENMVGPHSYKLGEVLTARNGTTIEVHNTDAEGRLVLADVLAYAAEQKPARIIDLATLTGACVVALGPDIAGAFTNDQDWCDNVLTAARNAGEELWQLPMYDGYAEQLKCDFADIKNVGSKWGGAITAAKFLEHFVDDIPWVHIDIAGPSFAESAKPYQDAGATGSSVRTVVVAAEALKSPTRKSAATSKGRK